MQFLYVYAPTLTFCTYLSFDRMPHLFFSHLHCTFLPSLRPYLFFPPSLLPINLSTTRPSVPSPHSPPRLRFLSTRKQQNSTSNCDSPLVSRRFACLQCLLLFVFSLTVTNACHMTSTPSVRLSVTGVGRRGAQDAYHVNGSHARCRHLAPSSVTAIDGASVFCSGFCPGSAVRNAFQAPDPAAGQPSPQGGA